MYCLYDIDVIDDNWMMMMMMMLIDVLVAMISYVVWLVALIMYYCVCRRVDNDGYCVGDAGGEYQNERKTIKMAIIRINMETSQSYNC